VIHKWAYLGLPILVLFVGCATVAPVIPTDSSAKKLEIKYDGASITAIPNHWVAYLNGKRIPESVFYTMTGDPKDSAEALKRERLCVLEPVGFVVAMLGLSNLAAALTYAPVGTSGWAVFGVSVPLFIGGNWAMVIGANNYKNVISSEDAIRMADEFNK
jgi:hypothetical protein